MKIRKQLTILVAVISAIPIFCALYFPLYGYFSSPNRMLIDGYKKIPEIEESVLSKDDLSKLESVFGQMPANVQTAVFSDKFDILASNIPELEGSGKLDYTTFWGFVENTTNKFFYQFTTMDTENSRVIILTRVPRQKNPGSRRSHAVTLLFTVLFFLVFFCIFYIIMVSRNIFRSITLIEKQTQDIADGNLNVRVETNQKNKNEITSITDSLEKMRLSLEDAQTRRNKFIMGISHDLRTPVAIIKGYTEAISDGMVKPEEMENTLNLIAIKTSQLENMINTLINFMKLDAKDWRENLKCESITTLITNFAHDAYLTGTVFKRNITSNIFFVNNVLVPLDTQLVTRCFENILSNAIRYTKENDKIEILARETDDSVILTIADEGEGMTEEDKKHIFDLFYRGTNSRREEGMGIGLSVVKSIICTLNWQLDVQSEYGKGSSFIITIPKKH